MAHQVTVVVTTYEHAHFLTAALDSVARQTVAPAEVIVVDDGSTDSPDEVVARWPSVRLIRQDNRGLSAARNTGLAASSSPYVIFLDADDLLTPVAVAAGLASVDRDPGAAMAYGAYRLADERGAAHGRRLHTPVPPVQGAAVAPLLRMNVVAMHATVLYERRALVAIGGFDESLRACEDYDVYLRLAPSHVIACHPVETALYRRHSTNSSYDAVMMLGAALTVHQRHRPPAEAPAEHRRAWREGRRNWRRWYASEAFDTARRSGRSGPRAVLEMARYSPVAAADRSRRKLRDGLRRELTGLGVGRRGPRPVGKVRLGDLDRTEPVSREFGYDRGLPVDRHYIESFLARYSSDIRGRVLEVGDAEYSQRWGGDRITQQDVLHVDWSNSRATVVGDVGQPGVLPDASFDCIVFTQTLHLVYDLPAAVSHLFAALRPGGVLLMTVPGMSPVDRGEWGETWYWALTPAAVRRLLGGAFPPDAVTLEVGGNVYAATTFLHGLALEEVDVGKLDDHDPAYPVVTCARAQRL